MAGVAKTHAGRLLPAQETVSGRPSVGRLRVSFPPAVRGVAALTTMASQKPEGARGNLSPKAVWVCK